MVANLPDPPKSHTLAQLIAQAYDDRRGQSMSVDELLPLAYQRLRHLGRSLIRAERYGHTLQPTAIVHEAYLRLSSADLEIHNGKHFYLLISETMRRVLVDHAKARGRGKRVHPSPEEIRTLVEAPIGCAEPVDIIDIDIALSELAKKSELAAEMAQLHYFFELSNLEISEICKVSESTIDRTLRFAKAWLAAYVMKINGL